MMLNFIAIALAITGILNPIVGALVHNAGSVLVIGIMVLVAGLYYFLKEKNDPESRKIYGIVSVAGAVVVVYTAVKLLAGF